MTLAVDPQLSNILVSAENSGENKLLSESSREMKDRDQIKKLSRDFESIFLGFMLKSMRKAVPKSGLLSGGNAENIYRSMLDAEYAQIMSKQHHTGLAKNIEEFLLRASSMEKEPVMAAQKTADRLSGNVAYGMQGTKDVTSRVASQVSSRIDNGIKD